MRAVSLVVSFTFAAMVPAQERAARAPNVVFVLADDLGYGELGSYGQQKIATPALDRLAAQGLRLTHHYAGAPVCAPSRCVLMTGLHPGHAPIRDNRELEGRDGQLDLAAGVPTLASVLQDAGYACGLFGKWGLGVPGGAGDPLRRGFDHWFGCFCQRHAHSHYPAFLWSDGEKVPLNEPGVPGGGKLAAGADANDAQSYARFRGEHFAPDRCVDEALAFVRANRERPFFCYVASTLPHLALQAPADAVAAYAGKFAETPYDGRNGYTPVLQPRATYAAMITRLDQHVGRLLDLLDELHLADDTIVVFTSDNGATHSPVGGTDVDFFASCGELRGRKGSLYEGGIRVPAIVRWPGRVPKGAQSAALSGFEDWLPTLAAACGAKTPAGLDGVDLRATLTTTDAPAPRAFLYREFAGYGGWQAVWASDGWKAVRSGLEKGEGRAELFDLATDGRETRDRIGDAPGQARLAALRAIAAREHTPSADFPLPTLDRR